MTEQLNQSERILQRHFDPQRTTPDRPDRLLKTRELATLLEFYLERGVRYGLMEPDAGEEARMFLDLLEGGYTLRFSRSGVVFDFDKPGTEPAEHEVGIEFHRVGSDLIRNLMDHAAKLMPRATDSSDASGKSDGDREVPRDAASATPPIPRLDSAAFLVADRARSTTDLEAESANRQDAGDAPASGTVEDSSVPGGSSVPAGEESFSPAEGGDPTR